jgi:hypothetical protein
MTTVRKAKRVLSPLLERHNDLAIVGPWLMLKPVRHLLRGVVIDRTGEASRFMPRWAVMSLCEPRATFPISWGGMIKRKGLWEWESQTLQSDLITAIEEQALPPLRAIRSLDDFFAFASSRETFPLRPFDLFLLLRVGVDIARGDLSSARAACDELKTGRTRWSSPDLREEFDRVTGTLCPLLAADDRPAMAHLLHEWEAYTVEKLKIGHIYEPTPFPLEVGPFGGGR